MEKYMQLLGLFLFGATVLLLSIIKFMEGWKKSLQISAVWLATVGVLAMMLEAVKIERDSAAFMVIGLVVLGGWATGIFIYGMRKGYISKLWKS